MTGSHKCIQFLQSLQRKDSFQLNRCTTLSNKIALLNCLSKYYQTKNNKLCVQLFCITILHAVSLKALIQSATVKSTEATKQALFFGQPYSLTNCLNSASVKSYNTIGLYGIMFSNEKLAQCGKISKDVSAYANVYGQEISRFGDFPNPS